MERLKALGLSEDEIETIDGLILEGKILPANFEIFSDTENGNARLAKALRKEIKKFSFQQVNTAVNYPPPLPETIPTKNEDQILEMKMQLLSLNNAVSSLRFYQTHPLFAVTTEADVIKQLKERNLFSHSLVLDQFLQDASNNVGWLNKELTLPFEVCPINRNEIEKTVNSQVTHGSQWYCTAIITMLQSDDVYYFEPGEEGTNHQPVNVGKPLQDVVKSEIMDRHSAVSFANRKPDIVGYLKGSGGEHAITFIGDVKPSESNDLESFTETQQGHIIDMVQELLRTVQPWRTKFLSFLTDTRRFQFFRTERRGEEFSHSCSRIYSMIHGYKLLLYMMVSDPRTVLGFTDYRIQGIEFSKILGIGTSKFVFCGKFLQMTGKSEPNEEIIIKLFEQKGKMNNEATILKTLNTSVRPELLRLIPQVRKEGLVSHNGWFALVTYPRCLPVQPHDSLDGLKGEVVTGSDVADLLDLLEEIHKSAIFHRDIKPANIFKWNGHIFLNDWGSAAVGRDEILFEGTFGFAVDDFIYQALTEGETLVHTPTEENDLLCLARSAYLMIFNQPPPLPPSKPVNDQYISKFWEHRFRKDTIWWDIMKESHEKNYSKLKELYRRIK